MAPTNNELSLEQLPELSAMSSGDSMVRIAPQMQVPLSERARALLDTPTVRRLGRVSQLGLVSLVYPGATHSRLEHSLGVYRMAILFLDRLRHEEAFRDRIDARDAGAFFAAALLHDVGHWPYCHPIEDMRLPGLHSHEFLAAEAITRGDVAEVLRTQWQLDPLVVADMVIGRSATPAKQVLTTMLSGAIDIDKMDYLVRDSHHAGVPYGMNFDEQRLIESLCLDESGTRLAITEKGRTAAEMMVFARYVMFSEVYWHHAVRAATAMLQRAVWIVQDLAPSGWFTSLDDSTFSETLLQLATGTPAAELVEGIFGPRRRLWKRAASFHQHEHQEIHQLLSGRSYADLLLVSGGVAEALSRRLSITIDPMLLLIDAPPEDREVEFAIDVRSTSQRGRRWKSLGELSPMVRAVAHEQFDDIVKRVRIFAPPESVKQIQSIDDFADIVYETARERLLKS